MNNVSWNHEAKESAVNKNVFNANKCFNFKRFLVLYISVYKYFVVQVVKKLGTHGECTDFVK